MGINVEIRDGKGSGNFATVPRVKGLPPGVVVYTEPYRKLQTNLKPYLNPTYGLDMNQNGAFSGTPEGIHDGTDAAKWTASALSGSWTFNSTAQAQTGTKSIDGTATKNNNEALFEDATNISTGSYTALSGWIYVTAWPSTGVKNLEFRNRLNGVDVGTAVTLAQYINVNRFNTWQKFAIPITEFNMGTTTIDELVIKVISVGGGGSPDFYLDNIQWEETGAPVTFTLAPDKGTIYNVHGFTIGLVSTSDSRLTDASHPNFTWDEFFGLTKLTIGLLVAATINGKFELTGQAQTFMDFVNQPGTTITTGGDGTTTWFKSTTTFPEPFRLDSRTNDNLQFIVNDDLSVLPYFRTIAIGTTEIIEKGINE